MIVTVLEWILKKATGPDGWRPAGAVRELPPTALVHDAQEAPRADEVLRMLSALGLAPTKVPVVCTAGDVPGLTRAISAGARACWATVVLEPRDGARAKNLGPAFRQYAHLHPDVVAVVVGPLPSGSEILNRYRHVVTEDDGTVAATDLAAGMAHASAARVIHCARLLNTAVVVFTLVAVVVGVGLASLGWFATWR